MLFNPMDAPKRGVFKNHHALLLVSTLLNLVPDVADIIKTNRLILRQHP